MMRALGWLGLMAAVCVLSYTALCLSVPFKAEAHYIEWLTPEEDAMFHWATSSWPSDQLWPREFLAKSVWDSAQVAEDSLWCPLEPVAHGTGTRKLWISRNPEGSKLQEHVNWRVPLFWRGWEMLQGHEVMVAPVGRLWKAHIEAQSSLATARATWNGGAFVSISLPFVADNAGFQTPEKAEQKVAPLWCFSFPSQGPRRWQWAAETNAAVLDSTLAAGGQGWTMDADTLALWDAFPSAASAGMLLDHVSSTLPVDSLEPVWAIRINNAQNEAQSRTAPKSKTATLFRFKASKISER